MDDFERALVEADRVNLRARLMRPSIDAGKVLVDMMLSSTEPVILFELETGKFYAVSMAFARALGYMPGELQGKVLLEFVHPDDLPATVESVGYSAKGVEPEYFANRYKHKDGHWLWLLWSPAKSQEDRRLGVAYANVIPDSERPEWLQAGFVHAEVWKKYQFSLVAE